MPRQCAQSAAYLIRNPKSKYTNIIPSAEAHLSLRGEKSIPSRREMCPIAEGNVSHRGGKGIRRANKKKVIPCKNERLETVTF